MLKVTNSITKFIGLIDHCVECQGVITFTIIFHDPRINEPQTMASLCMTPPRGFVLKAENSRGFISVRLFLNCKIKKNKKKSIHSPLIC